MVEKYYTGVRMIKPKRPQISRSVETLGRGAIYSYRFFIGFAAIWLALAIAFALASPEQLAQRLLTVALFGLVPAFIAYLIGSATYCALMAVKKLYDPISIALHPLFVMFNNIATIIWCWLGRPAVRILWISCGVGSALLRFGRARIATVILYLFRNGRRHLAMAARTFLSVVTLPVRLLAQLLIRLMPSTV
jgi:hypothetical protein